MHIQDIFQQSSPTFSFEFFPPKTPESSDRLYHAIRELEPLKPSFVSVTYGAGGSTRGILKLEFLSVLVIIDFIQAVGRRGLANVDDGLSDIGDSGVLEKIFQ